MSDNKMSNFTWYGPVQGVEIKKEGKVVFKANLGPGKTYAMPADHKLVKSWKASGLITLAKVVSTKPSKTAPGTTGAEGKGA